MPHFGEQVMKTMLLLSTVVLTLAMSVGCQDQNKAAAVKNGSVLDVNDGPVAPREPDLAYAAPLTATPAPGYYDASVTQTPGAGVAVASAGGSYTVKKGDTLFSIAKASYGNGNQWQKIAAANPGLSPETLKAGQRIVIP